MRKFLFLALLCPFLSMCQQPRNSTPPLSINDAVPEFPSSTAVNNSGFRLSDYRGKLLIIDFFSTTCRSCIKKLPELHALQKQYGPAMQIVLVTAEDSGRVQNFLRKNKVGQSIHLPCITNDSTLRSWFPHQFISHVVWLQNGVVRAITSSQYVDDNNIELMLSGRPVHWPVKRDVTEYDYNKPLLAINPTNAPEESHPSSVFYSAFTGYLDGIPSRSVKLADSTVPAQRIAMINMPLVTMYLKALGLPVDYPTANMVLNLTDTARLVYNPAVAYKLDWQQHNFFCYEANLPASMDGAALTRKILSDLQTYTGLAVSLVKKYMDCWVLRPLHTSKQPKTATHSANAVSLISVSDLVYELAHSRYGKPVIDETGRTDFLPFQKEWLTNIPALRLHLNQYGLDLVKEKRLAEVLVFSSKN